MILLDIIYYFKKGCDLYVPYPLSKSKLCKTFVCQYDQRLGDGIDSIAFTWLTYALTKNASLSAIVFAANVLPTVLFQPLAAPFVDRMQKQKVMVWSDLLRGLSLQDFCCCF